ncbi:MAG: hypothetical protein ACRC10_04550 [Thermoguttaceae bacterium]
MNVEEIRQMRDRHYESTKHLSDEERRWLIHEEAEKVKKRLHEIAIEKQMQKTFVGATSTFPTSFQTPSPVNSVATF